MFVLVASGDVSRVAPESEPTTIAGELVIPLESCTCTAPCRCRRSWFGMASGGVTPTAVVADRVGVEPVVLRLVIAEHLKRLAAPGSVDAVLDQLYAITQRFPEGAILARVGDHVTEVKIHASD